MGLLYSIDHCVGAARDLADRLNLRLDNQTAAGNVNQIQQTQDEYGYPILILSHGGTQTEGNPVIWIRITNLFEPISGVSPAGSPVDVFGNATMPFTPSIAQIAYEITAATFTVSSASATVGAVYSNNGVNFTVASTIASQTTLVMNGVAAPLASGTLTKVSGTGDSTITFSAVTGLALIPASSDYSTCLFEIARMGTVVQQFNIANGTAVTEAAVNAQVTAGTGPVQQLKDIDWGFKGNT
jgi:hypothetical protein